MAFSQSVRLDTLRTVAFGGISGTYVVLGAAFSHLARAVKITNLTAGNLFVSATNGSTPSSGGTEDNMIIPAGGFTLYDFTSNGGESQAKPFCFEKGTQFWVRQSTAPVSGAIYLEIVYGKGE